VDVEEAARRVHVFADEDYRFGAGPMHLTIEDIDWNRPFLQDGEHWYEANGIEMTEDGRVVGRRRVLIRGSRLARLRAANAARRSGTR
jgi:hypothetical protein